jgi:uncharacterized protein with HEPN domain
MIRKFKLYIQDIIDSIINLQEYTNGMNFEEFRKDKKTIDAVIRNFEIIGEATKNVPDEIRNKHNSIPWKDMAGMRDKLIHQYFGVKINVVWAGINELKAYQNELYRIIAEEEE